MPDRLAQLLGALSLAATDRSRSAVEGAVGRGGAHAAALVHLDVHRGTSVQALAVVLGVSQPAAVKIVDRLARDALLERRPGTDRRALALHLTDAGRERAVRILAGRADALTGLLALLDTEERERLEPLLEKLVASLARERGAALTVCRLCDREACSGSRGGCPLDHTVA